MDIIDVLITISMSVFILVITALLVLFAISAALLLIERIKESIENIWGM